MISIRRTLSGGAVGSAVIFGALVFASAIPAAAEVGNGRSLLENRIEYRGQEQLRLGRVPRGRSIPKLDAQLAALARGRSARMPANLRDDSLSSTADGKVRVVVETSRPGALPAIVRAAGGRVERTWRSLVQVVVPASALETLSRRRAVHLVRVPARSIEESVQGEEVQTDLAAAWHAKGFTGKRVKVAVIDGGFAGLSDRQAAGELPTNVVTMDLCGGHLSDATEHGTAVAEIVHEMAPDAELYLVCVNTEIDLAAAEAYAKSQGVRIINHSMGWWGEWRSDGSGPVGAIVADARANGILWVNAAGNEADTHWAGTFNGNGDSVHDFAPGDEGNSFIWPDDSEICGFLKWDEWPAGISDFDLYLVLSGTNEAVAWSAEYQSGSQPPVEGLCEYQSTGVDLQVYWAIDGYRVSSSPRLDLFSWSPSLQYATPEGSIADPASSPAAFAVGALCWQSRQLEYYSSQGPTIDGRMKPDIAGHDSVSSSTYGQFTSCPSAFAGTSAAAPEVVGAAALVAQAYPKLVPDEIQQYLEKAARDLGAPGRDNLTGSGELQLPTPPDLVAPTAKALASKGRAGRSLQLLSRVSDDSGDVSIVEQVKRNGRVVAVIRRKGFVTAPRPRTIAVAWRSPRTARGAYLHCVQSTDRAGNRSSVSCAKVVIR